MEISRGRLLGTALRTLAPNKTTDNTGAHPRTRFYVLRAGLVSSRKARSLAGAGCKLRLATALAALECDFKEEEYARLKGLALPGAKSRVQRARRRLREHLTKACQVKFDEAGKVSASCPGSRPSDFRAPSPTRRGGHFGAGSATRFSNP
jgi:hypothetical protein